MDLKEAAQRLGVHYQTAYRWVREGALAAGKIGQSYEVTEDEVARFLAERAEPAPPPRKTQVRSWATQSERLNAMIREGDELAARALVDRLVDGAIEPIVLCEQLFTPALVRLGEQWAAGEISVAVEHRASEVCERLLARVAVHPRGRPRGMALVCTPPGEQHGLPALMAAIVLRADRWQVHHLGTEVPTDDLSRMVDDIAPQLVVFSIAQAHLRSAAESAATAVRRHGPAVLIGNPGDTLHDLLAQARATSRSLPSVL